MSHTAAEHTAAAAGRTELENTAAAERKFVAAERTVAAHTAAAGSADIDPAGTDPADTDPADTDSADTEIVDTEIVDTDSAGTDSADTEIDHIAADCTHQIADLHKIARFEKNFQHYKNYCSLY